MSDVRIIGLTGPVQTGKIQLAHVFREMGWRVVDLNDVIYDARIAGTREYDRLQALMPGCLDAEGVETGAFYRLITPQRYVELLAGYLETVRAAAETICQRAQAGERIVLSWEYLARIAPELPLDRMILCRQDRDIWYGRMRDRASELSGGSWRPDDTWLDGIVATLDVDPATIAADVRHAMTPDRVTVLDVGDDDWGEAELRLVLSRWS